MEEIEERAPMLTDEQLGDALGSLAVAQAVYKMVEKVVSTKDATSLRSACDEELRRRYESGGAKSYDMKLNGKKVGTFSVVASKEVEPEEVPERTTVGGEITDKAKFVEWLFDTEDGRECLYYGVTDDWSTLEQLATRTAQDGLVVPGVEAWCNSVPAHTRPGKPSEFKHTSISGLKPEMVYKAMGEALPTAVAGLLGGGNARD